MRKRKAPSGANVAHWCALRARAHLGAVQPYRESWGELGGPARGGSPSAPSSSSASMARQERGPNFLRLANALSALYPKVSDEKRLLDAMLLAVSR